MTSCLASSSNIGSSKNLLMETSSLRPCRERGRGRGHRKTGNMEEHVFCPYTEYLLHAGRHQLDGQMILKQYS